MNSSMRAAVLVSFGPLFSLLSVLLFDEEHAQNTVKTMVFAVFFFEASPSRQGFLTDAENELHQAS